MMGRNTLLLGLFLNGFVAWMLSGSPVPMGFCLLFPLLAGIARSLKRPHSEGIVVGILFSFLGLLALLAEVYLFRTGLAFAFRADLPFSFHLGLALLRVSSSFAIFYSRAETEAHPDLLRIPAIAGFVLVFASCPATELYDYDEWQVYPLAALPLAVMVQSLFPGSGKRFFGFLLPLLVASVFALAAVGVDRGMIWISDTLRSDDGRLSETEGLRRPAPNWAEGDGGGGARRLPRETDIQFDGRIQLVIETGSPTLFQSWRTQPVYVRTSTVAVFESDELIAPVRSGRWLYDIEDESEDFAITLAPLESAPLASYTVCTARRSSNALPLLPRSSTISVPAIYEYADDWYQVTPPEDSPGIRYEAVLPVSARRPRPLDPRSLVRRSAPGIYLNLPPSPLAGRIRDLVDQYPAHEILSRIRGRLEEETTYTLRYETPPETTPVEDLLFGSKQGHCELYAASAALLLRAAGIPSRIAYGYAGGLMDPERRMLAFRDQDSHAWAEILTENNEWIIFDVTPEVSTAAPRSAQLGSLAEFSSEGYTNLSLAGTPLEDRRRPFPDRLTDLVLLFSDHFLPISLIAFLFAGGGMIWQKRRSRRTVSSPVPDTDPGHSPILDELISLLESCGNRIGVRKERGMTWREWLRRLPEVPGCFSDAVDYYYETRYVGLPGSGEREKSLRRSLRDWKDSSLED